MSDFIFVLYLYFRLVVCFFLSKSLKQTQPINHFCIASNDSMGIDSNFGKPFMKTEIVLFLSLVFFKDVNKLGFPNFRSISFAKIETFDFYRTKIKRKWVENTSKFAKILNENE